jgi:hypothetical protein
MAWLNGAMDTVKVPAVARPPIRHARIVSLAIQRQLKGEPGSPFFLLVC